MVDYIVELLIDGAWQNITSDVRDSSPLLMNRGRRDWASVTDPATLSLTLNNGPSNVSQGVQGRYSPRNPRSDLFGKIGRNTPVRVRRGDERDRRLEQPGFRESYTFAPDTAALSVTGDLDVQIDIEPPSWRPESGGVGFSMDLISKYETTGDQRSWILNLKSDGELRFRWSTDGTFGNSFFVDSSDPIPEDTTRLAVRVKLDVDNGAGELDVTFETAPTIDGPWTQLGNVITGAIGTTNVFDSTADVAIGAARKGFAAFNDSILLEGAVFAAKVLDGIDGTEVANPDFTVHEPNTRSFTDAAGNDWTLQNHATFADLSIRFAGEMKSWPVRWDLSGADRWVKASAAGVSRRLQKGKKPVESSLFRDLSKRDGVVAYWPLEESVGAARFRSGRPNDSSTLVPVPASAVTLAADSETFVATEPLPTVGAGTIRGNVPSYSSSDNQRFAFLVSIPADVTWGSDKVLARFFTTGSIRRWDIEVTSSDTITVRAFDADDTQVDAISSSVNMFGLPSVLSLRLDQEGADVVYTVSRFEPGESGVDTAGNTINGETFGRFSGVELGSTDDMETTTFGHAFLLTGDAAVNVWDIIFDAAAGWAGETALDRIGRVGQDNALTPVRYIGDHSDAEDMGAQPTKTLMEIFRECATADLGILTDRRDAVGLQYRTRVDLYVQEPKLTLDYSSGILADLAPVDDDQNLANAVTVERPRGSSFTAADTTGPLSSLDPPVGVGLYDISAEVNIEEDERLTDQAFWRLHLGTVDEQRFPEVTLNLRNPQAEALLDDILSVSEGDIIRITNPPEWLPGGPYDLFVEAVSEEKRATEHEITFACSPGSAWNALTLDDAEVGRLDTGGSTLGEALTTTQTVFDVATDAGSQVWVNTDIALVLPGDATFSQASTPDAAALDITGDIDIRVEVSRDDWTSIAGETMAAKYLVAGDERSWRFDILSTGLLRLAWSTDGTVGAVASVPSEVVPPRPSWGRVAYRVTLDASLGNVTFYWAESIAGPWEQVGAVVPAPTAPTSIHSGAADLTVGGRPDDVAGTWDGEIYAVQVFDGIGGTLVADPDFTAQAIGGSSFTDSTGLVWTLEEDARIDPGDPFDIITGGEVMTVHSITGTTSPQEFTVRRAVNGVVKSHATGGSVSLAKPFVLSL